jgi:hypothetical protein
MREALLLCPLDGLSLASCYVDPSSSSHGDIKVVGLLVFGLGVEAAANRGGGQHHHLGEGKRRTMKVCVYVPSVGGGKGERVGQGQVSE